MRLSIAITVLTLSVPAMAQTRPPPPRASGPVPDGAVVHITLTSGAVLVGRRTGGNAQFYRIQTQSGPTWVPVSTVRSWRFDGPNHPLADPSAPSGGLPRAGAPEGVLPQPNREQIHRGMARIAGAIRACASGQSGMVVLRIRFASDGTVSSAQVASGPFVGTPAAACMENAARAARVPTFTNASVTVSYPIMVQSADPAAATGGAQDPGATSEPAAGPDESVVPEGQLDTRTVVILVSRHLPQLRACYERQLRNEPGLDGQITMRFTVGAGGRVTDTSVVDNSTGSNPLASCVASNLRTWRFPEPERGAAAFEYPFRFGL